MMFFDIGIIKDRKEIIKGIVLKKNLWSISLISRDNEYSMNVRGSICKVYFFLIVG